MKKIVTYLSGNNGEPKKIIEVANIMVCEYCGHEMRYSVSCPVSCSKCYATIALDGFVFSNKKERVEYHDNYGFGHNDCIPGYMYI